MIIADLHIHSRYSRGCSNNLTPATLWQWGQLKGVSVLGTGDFTHPAWYAELCATLEPVDGNLLRLKDLSGSGRVFPSCHSDLRFMLTAEISCIYKRHGRVRKNHLLLLAPDFTIVSRINAVLAKVGNINSDGRPILGLDACHLLEMMLEISPRIIVIPAHAWTPHFSVFGAFSGFDSLEECFGDLTPHIRAIETGLSSDPAMNRRVPLLDDIQLISNSDAHSGPKIAREATLFDCALDYDAIIAAISTGEGLQGTIEFFPQEGKYFLDGHRACGVCLEPQETGIAGGRCPVCGGKITIGVMNRVSQLAAPDRTGIQPHAKSVEYIIPLPEIISSVLGVGQASKKVQSLYLGMLEQGGNELSLLRTAPAALLAKSGSEAVAEAIIRVRRGDVTISPGYDGVFGTIVPQRGKSKPDCENS